MQKHYSGQVSAPVPCSRSLSQAHSLIRVRSRQHPRGAMLLPAWLAAIMTELSLFQGHKELHL